MLTQEFVKSILEYNPDTGIFHWKKPTSFRCKAGEEAGYSRFDGRVQIRINYRLYFAHQIAWLYMTGEWPELEIDHCNRIPSDNRFANLRLVTHAQNMQNVGMKSNNTSGYVGVFFHKRAQKWMAQLKTKKKTYYLGLHETKEQAREAYLAAKSKYHEF